MVVKSRLDLGYLALFLGMRVNQLVMERLRAAGFESVRESHGYVIQHLVERERSITDLAARMEVTQQAASKVVAELAALGILEVLPGEEDRRAKKVRLSARAWAVVKLTRQLRGRIERQLMRAAGPDRYESARSILTVCLGALGGLERVRSRRVAPPEA